MPFNVKKVKEALQSTKNKAAAKARAGHMTEVKVTTLGGDVTFKYPINSMILLSYNWNQKVVLIFKGDDRYSINRKVDRSNTADVRELESKYPVINGEITGHLRHSEVSLGRWIEIEETFRCTWNTVIDLDLWPLSTKSWLPSVSSANAKKELVDELQGPCLSPDGDALRQIPILFWSDENRIKIYASKCLKTLKDIHAQIPSVENNLFQKTLEDADLDANAICEVDLLEKCISVAYKLCRFGKCDSRNGERYIPDVSKLSAGSTGHIVFEIMLWIQIHVTNFKIMAMERRVSPQSNSYLSPGNLVKNMSTMKRFQPITDRFKKSEVQFKTDDGETGWIS